MSNYMKWPGHPPLIFLLSKFGRKGSKSGRTRFTATSRRGFTQCFHTGRASFFTFAQDFSKITPSVFFRHASLLSEVENITSFQRGPLLSVRLRLDANTTYRAGIKKKLVETLVQFYLIEGNQIQREMEKDILGSRSATTKQVPVRFCLSGPSFWVTVLKSMGIK